MPAPFSSSEQPSACPPYKEATLLLGLGALLLGMGVLLLVLQILVTPAARPLAMLFTSDLQGIEPRLNSLQPLGNGPPSFCSSS